jgi:exodeoxyribonuclease-3
MAIKIVSWNVNGLRAAMQKGFLRWLAEAAPDIVCLQEVRAGLKDLWPLEASLPGYKAYWQPAERPGYAGVAVLTRFVPTSQESGLDGGADPEGRALTVDFGAFRIASLYGPNSPADSGKLTAKVAWLEALGLHCRRLDDKPLILCGDLNVAHHVIDSRNELHPRGLNGCTDEERSAMRNLMSSCHLLDPVREQAGDTVLSTWWSPTDLLRRPASGIRLDYALLHERHRGLVRGTSIDAEVRGSDHCPVSLTVELPTAGLPAAVSGGQKALW